MIYVASIRANDLVITGAGESLRDTLQGFATKGFDNNVLVVFFQRDELAKLLTRLQEMGVAFAGGAHGWPPAEVFADMRDKGLVAGPFYEIVFRGGGDAEIRQRP